MTQYIRKEGVTKLDFTDYLLTKSNECNASLDRYLTRLNDDRASLYEAMRYSAASGGKRLRMIVLLETARLFSDNITDCVPFACAVEMIHTYSLIHDDLPSMDNADYRRGKLSNHKKFDECTAILAGDGLLHYAFETMSGTSEIFGYEKSHLYLKALNEIACCSGITGMVLGQAIDTQQKSLPGLDSLLFIYSKKTAAMFVGAMKAGAIIAGADSFEIKAVSDYAYNLGMAFQITDDILDETGNFDQLGKKTGNDKDNGKHTIMSVLGMDKACALASEYIKSAKKDIEACDKYSFFAELCHYVINRKS